MDADQQEIGRLRLQVTEAEKIRNFEDHEEIALLREQVAETHAWEKSSRMVMRAIMSWEGREKRQLLRHMLQWKHACTALRLEQEQAKRSVRAVLRMIDGQEYRGMHAGFTRWRTADATARRVKTAVGRALVRERERECV